MTDKDKHALIYRVVSGYTILGSYIIDTPTDSLINESLVVRADAIRKHRFENLMLQEETEKHLFMQKMWTPKDTGIIQSLRTARN